jgi:hypothetical protein
LTDLDQTYVDNNSDARLGEFDPRMLYTTHIHKYQHNGYDDGWTINRHVGNWHYHLVSSFGHVLYRMIYCSEVTKLLIDNIKIKTIEFDRPVEYKQYKPGEAIERKRIPIRKLKLAFITFNVGHIFFITNKKTFFLNYIFIYHFIYIKKTQNNVFFNRTYNLCP